MPIYSYYADYILALTKNVCKSNKSPSSERHETPSTEKSSKAPSSDKTIISDAKSTAKSKDDVRTYHFS